MGVIRFIYAVITGPYFGLMALLRSWIWILAVMGAFALTAGLEATLGGLIVFICLMLVALVFLIMLSYSVARESLIAIRADWAIHPDVAWMSAFWKFFGANLLYIVWVIVVGIVLIAIMGAVGGALLGYELPPNFQQDLTNWLMIKASDPYATVEGSEYLDAFFFAGLFAFNVIGAVFGTTFVAAAAGNGVLSRNGWTLGHATLRVALAAMLYGWLSWHITTFVTPYVMQLPPEIAVAVMAIISWGLNWSMLMGCASQLYVRRLQWDLSREQREEAAIFEHEDREGDARALRQAWMSDDR